MHFSNASTPPEMLQSGKLGARILNFLLKPPMLQPLSCNGLVGPIVNHFQMIAWQKGPLLFWRWFAAHLDTTLSSCLFFKLMLGLIRGHSMVSNYSRLLPRVFTPLRNPEEALGSKRYSLLQMSKISKSSFKRCFFGESLGFS